jgi:hypothetical protein
MAAPWVWHPVFRKPPPIFTAAGLPFAAVRMDLPQAAPRAPIGAHGGAGCSNLSIFDSTLIHPLTSRPLLPTMPDSGMMATEFRRNAPPPLRRGRLPGG